MNKFDRMIKKLRPQLVDELKQQAKLELLNSNEPVASWAVGWEENHPLGTAGTKNKSNRERWLKQTLASIPEGKKILDAGAGELQYKRFCKHLDYVSQDFAQYDGSGDEAGLQMGKWDNSKLDIVSDILAIPVKDHSFDAIMCIEVFEHIPKPVEAIKEFSRILKKGGRLIITVPVSSLTHFAPYYYYNGFSRYFFEDLLAENGFKILGLVQSGNYFEYLAQELRRLDSVAEQYSIKKPANNIESLARHILLRRLSKLSARDRGSRELLSYGINVLAEKL